MGTYTEFLEEYLQGSRYIKKGTYKLMNGVYRAIQNGRITLETFSQMLSSSLKNKGRNRRNEI